MDPSARPAGPDARADAVVSFEREHGQTLFGFARGLGLDDQSAADVVQEALERLFRVLMSGQRISDLKAWTFHVAYRLAIDEHRRFSRVRRLVRSTGPVVTNGGDSDIVDRRVVWSAVDGLPARQRAVLILRYRADMTFDDVAQVLGITASAARSHSTQALATLRRRLDRTESD